MSHEESLMCRIYCLPIPCYSNVPSSFGFPLYTHTVYLLYWSNQQGKAPIRGALEGLWRLKIWLTQSLLHIDYKGSDAAHMGSLTGFLETCSANMRWLYAVTHALMPRPYQTAAGFTGKKRPLPPLCSPALSRLQTPFNSPRWDLHTQPTAIIICQSLCTILAVKPRQRRNISF